MARGLTRLVLIGAFSATAVAQSPLPQFEIATIKPPGPQDSRITLFNYPGGRVLISLYTVTMLLYETLGVHPFQIVGAPAWMDSERFLIEAKPPASSKLSSFTPPNVQAPLVDEQKKMLIALLEDRFHLKFHRESKEGVVFLLTKGSKALLLEEPKHPESRRFFAGLLGGGDGSVSAANVTMEFIVSMLSRSVGGPVLDQTGLTGAFDFNLKGIYEPEERDLVTIAHSTVRALGLKLERTRGPVETIFIDHVEKPSPN